MTVPNETKPKYTDKSVIYQIFESAKLCFDKEISSIEIKLNLRDPADNVNHTEAGGVKPPVKPKSTEE